MASPDIVSESSPAQPSESVQRVTWQRLAAVALVGVQLLLVLLVLRNFRLMSVAAADVFKLAAVGFIAHVLAPAKYRLPLFIALSAGAILHVLGWADGARLLLVGVALIGICHLPIAWGARVALLLAAGALLTVGRAGLFPLLSPAVWPILAAMFMFRLIIYVYDIRHEPALATWSGALSYFLLLPNVAFPFFPVVDYKTFRRTYYDTDEARIYQTGVAWMLRGLVHLVLYRFVYYYLTIAPEEVQTSRQLVQFIVANYALYLRVSGTFHLVVGLLHLFGFNLPPTNQFYFLASSFTDYWRRTNIYWKDFMMKVVYYPAFFRLRRVGQTAGLVLATLAVFIVTTTLHSYQWFWLRGDWYLSPQDLIFWSTLAVFVVINVVYEAKKGRKRSLGKRAWSLKDALGRGVRIVLTFTVLSSLWSLWTAPSFEEWVGLWSVWNVGLPLSRGMAVILGSVVAVLIGGAVLLTRTQAGRAAGVAVSTWWTRWRESPATVLTSLVLILGLSHPWLRKEFPSTPLLVLEDLQERRLSRQDQEQLERGYYENLFGVERVNPELARLFSSADSNWVSLWQTDAVRSTGDLRRLEPLPSVSMTYKGVPFTTNEWGMRDRDRTLEPAPGVFRVAVLGASTTMGSGVRDDETFPRLVEAMFSAGHPPQAVEMMNFAVESYNAIEQAAVVDLRLPRFHPHAVLYVAHETEFEKTTARFADLVQNRTDLVYDELQDIVRQSGVEPGTKTTIALRQLGRHREDVVGWAYRHIVERARSRGMSPFWVFIPMPVPGTGACPPGNAQLFCFGNTSRVGAPADASDPRVRRLFELARQAGFVTLDLSGIYGTTDLNTLWISARDGHPNVPGHRMIADGLYGALWADSAFTAAVEAARDRSGR